MWTPLFCACRNRLPAKGSDYHCSLPVGLGYACVSPASDHVCDPGEPRRATAGGALSFRKIFRRSNLRLDVGLAAEPVSRSRARRRTTRPRSAKTRGWLPRRTRFYGRRSPDPGSRSASAFLGRSLPDRARSKGPQTPRLWAAEAPKGGGQ